MSEKTFISVEKVRTSLGPKFGAAVLHEDDSSLKIIGEPLDLRFGGSQHKLNCYAAGARATNEGKKVTIEKKEEGP